MRRALVLVALAACSAKPKPASPTPAPDCAAAVAAAQKLVTDSGAPAAEAERVKGVVALRCVEDRWPAGAIQCVTAAADFEGAHACIGLHLAPEQQDRLMKQLDGDKPTETPAPMTAAPAPGTLEPEPSPENPGPGQATIAAKLNTEAIALFRKKAFARATDKFREAVARVPEARYFLNLCLALHAEGRFAEAFTACQAGTMNAPSETTRRGLDAATAKVLADAKDQQVEIRE